MYINFFQCKIFLKIVLTYLYTTTKNLIIPISYFYIIGMTFGRDRVDSHIMNTNGMPGLQSMLGQSLDPFSIFGLTRQNWYEGPSKSIFLMHCPCYPDVTQATILY